jgi:hypothetical protein
MKKKKKQNFIFRWVDNYADYRYAYQGWKLIFRRFGLFYKFNQIYKKWYKVKKIEKPVKLNKKIKRIVQWILWIFNEKYWYIRVIIMLIILYIIYEPILFWRYLISLMLFIFILRYKLLYYYLNFKETQEQIKMIFKNHNSVNLIGKWIYIIINPVLWWYSISILWLEIVKIIRYISIKISVYKYWYYIDIVMNYIINIYMKLWIIKLWNLIKKKKEKIIKKK